MTGIELTKISRFSCSTASKFNYSLIAGMIWRWFSTTSAITCPLWLSTRNGIYGQASKLYIGYKVLKICWDLIEIPYSLLTFHFTCPQPIELISTNHFLTQHSTARHTVDQKLARKRQPHNKLTTKLARVKRTKIRKNSLELFGTHRKPL